VERVGCYMSIQQMLLGDSAAALGATLNGATPYTDYNTSPGPAEAGFRVHSDGTFDYDQTIVWYNEYTWLTGGGVNSDYEVRYSKTGGNGTLGAGSSANATWLACSTTRTWYITNSVASSLKNYVGTLEIRMAATPNTVLATQTVTLEAALDL